MKIIKSQKYQKLLYIFISPFILVAALSLFIFSYNLLYWGKIFPNTNIAGIKVSKKTTSEAIDILQEKISVPDKIFLVFNGQTFEIPTGELKLSYGFHDSANRAYSIFRTGNIFYDTKSKIDSIKNPTNIGLSIQYDEKMLDEYLSVIAGEISTDPIYPSAYYTNNDIVVVRGRPGLDVDIDELKLQIGQNLAYTRADPINIKTNVIDPSLSEEEAEYAKERVKLFFEKSLKLTFQEEGFIFNQDEIVEALSFPEGFNNKKIESFINDITETIDKDPQSAIFEFKDGKVQEFLPAKSGITIKSQELESTMSESLNDLETSDNKQIIISIPFEEKEPSITTEQVNNLGIKELLGRGESTFRGSISSRIHNINLASSKFNGTLVPPGEIFSFNSALGDVSEYTGYKQAYIIKDGKTVLGDGGGVCQVSTTFFRAILNAGLPVIERRAHSYRVSYYEQDSAPGIDATVYSPTTDIKIKNDTENHLLIQARISAARSQLIFEIYGTSDSRIAEISEPIVSDVSPPPEDLYVDDPSLPEGTIKQIDWKAWGAKVRFNYRVYKQDKMYYEKTFYSNYRSWQSVYLKGTGPTN